jgi:hypothetical protein
VSEAFDTFLGWQTPLESQRIAASKHRAGIEAAINAKMSTLAFRETGSFRHGTGVRNYSDVDLLVSIGGTKPGSSDTALGWVRDALKAKYPHTSIYVDRPAVVAEFANGAETWEVIPGFLNNRRGDDIALYDIPGRATGWIESAPGVHLNYVTEVNQIDKVKGGAKKLARLAKAWKYYNNVPISSFYFEMRAAEHMKTQNVFIAVSDLCMLLEGLWDHQLAAMNDPKGVTSRFYACSTKPKRVDALSKLHTAAARARRAIDAWTSSRDALAFTYLDLLFNGHFPARET